MATSSENLVEQSGRCLTSAREEDRISRALAAFMHIEVVPWLAPPVNREPHGFPRGAAHPIWKEKCERAMSLYFEALTQLQRARGQAHPECLALTVEIGQASIDRGLFGQAQEVLGSAAIMLKRPPSRTRPVPEATPALRARLAAMQALAHARDPSAYLRVSLADAPMALATELVPRLSTAEELPVLETLAAARAARFREVPPELEALEGLARSLPAPVALLLRCAESHLIGGRPARAHEIATRAAQATPPASLQRGRARRIAGESLLAAERPAEARVALEAAAADLDAAPEGAPGDVIEITPGSSLRYSTLHLERSRTRLVLARVRAGLATGSERREALQEELAVLEAFHPAGQTAVQSACGELARSQLPGDPAAALALLQRLDHPMQVDLLLDRLEERIAREPSEAVLADWADLVVRARRLLPMMDNRLKRSLWLASKSFEAAGRSGEAAAYMDEFTHDDDDGLRPR